MKQYNIYKRRGHSFSEEWVPHSHYFVRNTTVWKPPLLSHNIFSAFPKQLDENRAQLLAHRLNESSPWLSTHFPQWGCLPLIGRSRRSRLQGISTLVPLSLEQPHYFCLLFLSLLDIPLPHQVLPMHCTARAWKTPSVMIIIQCHAR